MLMVLRERPLVRVVIRHKESRVVIANVFVTQHTFAHPAVITAEKFKHEEGSMPETLHRMAAVRL